MEVDCWSIFALENVNSLAASIALNREFNGGGVVVSYLNNKGDNHETNDNRTSSCTRTDKLGCAGASNVRSLNRFARGSLGRFVCRSSGGLLHESTHVEHDVPFSPSIKYDR
jgi:hypothetical protein